MVYNRLMARLTITLSDERHQQLKLRAAREGTTIGKLIESALEERDESARRTALALADKARTTAARTMAGMSDDDVERWVAAEVRSYRAGRGIRSAS
ncbi:MAG: hypothetical protein AMXMBFR80_10470 [Dehalococcoidia bacterium]